MRTSISLEDRLAERVRRQAADEGLSVSAYIARILDDALKRPAEQTSTPFHLITVGGEGVRPGVDLDRPRSLMVAEDEARYGSDDGQS